jgi:hypothetical protein
MVFVPDRPVEEVQPGVDTGGAGPDEPMMPPIIVPPRPPATPEPKLPRPEPRPRRSAAGHGLAVKGEVIRRRRLVRLLVLVGGGLVAAAAAVLTLLLTI